MQTDQEGKRSARPTNLLSVKTDRARLARRLFWWKPPREALADPNRFLAQVMTYGTWEDIVEARRYWDHAAWREALAHAPPGVFDRRSWVYWHHALGMLPIPPLPARTLPDGV
jgi:hypothetical protein